MYKNNLTQWHIWIIVECLSIWMTSDTLTLSMWDEVIEIPGQYSSFVDRKN